MPCPLVHLCDRQLCQKESICMDAGYWAAYWKNKTKKEEVEKGITPKERRVARKEEKKRIGRKRFHFIEKQSAIIDVYRNTPLCVHNGTTCDKYEACSVLSQCIVTISRFKDKPSLLEALRGPKTVKEIVRILSIHDPEPMKSYYLHSKNKFGSIKSNSLP